MKQLPFIIMFLFVFMISGNCPANESVQHKITSESDAKDKDNHQESKENIEWASAHDMNVRLGKGINIGLDERACVSTLPILTGRGRRESAGPNATK